MPGDILHQFNLKTTCAENFYVMYLKLYELKQNCKHQSAKEQKSAIVSLDNLIEFVCNELAECLQSVKQNDIPNIFDISPEQQNPKFTFHEHLFEFFARKNLILIEHRYLSKIINKTDCWENFVKMVTASLMGDNWLQNFYQRKIPRLIYLLKAFDNRKNLPQKLSIWHKKIFDHYTDLLELKKFFKDSLRESQDARGCYSSLSCLIN